MTAQEIKQALRARHGPHPMAWTCIEEFANIDLLAFASWSSARPGLKGVRYPIVGYEIKVSRSDYRREVLRPGKRAAAVARCHAFYFAVPKGLLKPNERRFVEPEHFDGQAFVRTPCPENCYRDSARKYIGDGKYKRGSSKTGRDHRTPVVYGDRLCDFPSPDDRTYDYGPGLHWSIHKRYVPPTEEQEGREPNRFEQTGSWQYSWRDCETCDGRGYLRKSVVEEQAPTLWIPRDVGLVEVSAGGQCRLVRQAPINPDPEPDWVIGDLVRWVSCRPDPRHSQTT